MTDNIPLTGRAARPKDAASIEKRAALDSWQKMLADQSVTEILRYRDLRKIGNDELRRRLDFLGWTLTRDSLSSILAGKRKTMPVADLILFGQALNVPPAALIFPVWTNQWTPLSPIDDERLSAYRQVKWFTGKDAEVGASHLAAPEHATVDEYYDVGDVVGRQEEIDDWMTRFESGNGNLLYFDLSPEVRARIEKEVREMLVDISNARRYLKSVYSGISLPPLRDAIAFLDEREWRMPSLPIVGYETPEEIQRWTSYRQKRSAGDEPTT